MSSLIDPTPPPVEGDDSNLSPSPSSTLQTSSSKSPSRSATSSRAPQTINDGSNTRPINEQSKFATDAASTSSHVQSKRVNSAGEGSRRNENVEAEEPARKRQKIEVKGEEVSAEFTTSSMESICPLRTGPSGSPLPVIKPQSPKTPPSPSEDATDTEPGRKLSVTEDVSQISSFSEPVTSEIDYLEQPAIWSSDATSLPSFTELLRDGVSESIFTPTSTSGVASAHAAAKVSVSSASLSAILNVQDIDIPNEHTASVISSVPQPNLPLSPSLPAGPSSASTSMSKESQVTFTSQKRTPAAQQPPPRAQPQPELLSSYNCPICFSPPTNAALTSCGHICCGSCLFMAVKSTLHRSQMMTAERSPLPRCPVCRAPIPGWDGHGGGVIGLQIRTVLSL